MRVLLIKDGVVVNVILADSVERAQAFYPDHEVIEQADGLGVGYQRVDDVWQAPARPVRPDEWRVTRLAFLSRFTDAEAIGIDLASQGATVQAATLRRFMQKINAAQYIELNDRVLVGGLQTLEAAGLLAQGRANEITSAPVLSHERLSGSQS